MSWLSLISLETEDTKLKNSHKKMTELELHELGLKHQPTLSHQLLRGKVYDGRDPYKKEKRVQDFLDGRKTIIIFLRRFGCPICRAVSTGITHLHERIKDHLDVRLIAVAIVSRLAAH